MGGLPPLYCLAAFDSAARFLSFTKAAKELNLSQSAVSRQIALVETYLGRSLFSRSRGTLALTEAGQQYANEVRGIINQYTTVTNRLIAGAANYDLTIACSSGLASYWLAPRLKGFLEDNPNVRARVLVRDKFQSLLPSEYDVGVFLFHETPPNMSLVEIFREEVIAVCAPSLLCEKRITPNEIAEYPIIALEDSEKSWMTWDGWFASQGIDIKTSTPRLTATRYAVILELASAGLGFALGWRNIIDPYLERKLLVQASDSCVSSQGAYYICWPEDRAYNPQRARFRDWILRQHSSAAPGVVGRTLRRTTMRTPSRDGRKSKPSPLSRTP